MPIRKYEAGIFDTQSVATKESKHLIAKGVGAVGVAALGVLSVNSGIGHADKIWVGGACDPDGNIPVSFAQAQGRWNPADAVVHYPAGMGMNCGPTSTEDSINIGAQQVVDFYYSHRGNGPVDAEGFSLGAGVIDKAADIVASQNGGQLPGDFRPVGNGDGWSPAGVLNHPVADLAAPIMNPILGLPPKESVHPVAGQVVRNDANDFFGTTGVDPWNIPQQIEKWVGSGMNGAHRMPDPREPKSVVVSGGVTYEFYGENHEAVAAEFQNEHGSDAPVVNANQASGIVHNSAPSFPGEAPCIAEDGSQYWTPGDAPCDGPAPAPAAFVASAPAQEVAPAPVEAPAPAPAPVVDRSPVPSFFGEAPCIAEDGSQYFTPGDAPC